MTLHPELKKALEAEMYKEPYEGEMVIEMNDAVRIVASFLEAKKKELKVELCDKGFCHNGVGVTDAKGNPHFCRNCKIIDAVFGGGIK